MAGRIALVGSGEYLPAMDEVEKWLFEGRPKRYIQLATASAPEGSDRLGYWHDLGFQAAERIGVEQVVIDVRNREDAFDAQWVDAIKGAGAIYLSGGNPYYLAETLGGTPVWDAIVKEWRAGASIAGCSAGAMALSGYSVDFRHWSVRHDLQILDGVRVLPHFDRYGRWIPDFAARAMAGANGIVVGVDELTALVGEGSGSTWEFRPMGKRGVWVVDEHDKHQVRESISLKVRDSNLS